MAIFEYGGVGKYLKDLERRLGLEFEIKTSLWGAGDVRDYIPNRVVKKNEAVGFFVRAFALAR